MLNVDPYIIKEGNIFYFDLDSYNKESDIPIDDGDTIKFNYDDSKYIGKVINNGGAKMGIFEIEVSKKL
jgi:hypothetical protein